MTGRPLRPNVMKPMDFADLDGVIAAARKWLEEQIAELRSVLSLAS